MSRKVESEDLSVSERLDEELTGGELQEVTALEPEFDIKLKEWLESANYEQLSAKVVLYKFDNPSSGNDKAVCGQWINEIPDAHTVGMTYGSGRYLILVTLPRGEKQAKTLRGFRFRIHPHYDELRRQSAMGLLPPSMYYGNIAGGHACGANAPKEVSISPASSLQESLGLVATIIKMLEPMIKPQNNGADMGAILAGTYETMNKVMQRQAIEQVGLLSDLTRRAAQLPLENEEEQEEEGGIWEQLKPLIGEIVPKLLSKGPTSTATATMIKALPQFKKVVREKVELKRLIGHLDKSIGTEKTSQVLKKLKIPHPA